ncbi:Transaldolase [Hortaea werneckii]|nr:Transaldolase [Hortaea werneckii]
MSPLHPTEKLREEPQYHLLSQYAHENGTGSLESTLDAFCEPIENRYTETTSPSNVEGLLWSAWQCLIGCAAATPHESEGQRKLVDLVLRLQHRAALEKEGEVCYVQGGVAWRDLPIFGWQMREAWNAAASDGSEEESKRHWINVNAWTAKMVSAAHAREADEPDLSLYCVWTLRMALETEAQPSNVSLSAAAVWLIYAAPTIWHFCLQGKTFDGKVAKPGPRAKDQEWRGFTRERWQAWMQRLISELEGQISDGVTKQMVDQALRAMSDAQHKVLTLPSNNLHIFEYHQNLIITEIMSSSLDQLKASGTTVVCDSGDFATIGKYKPQDATTNPSLILAAAKKPEYAKLVDNAVAHGKQQSKDIDEQVEHTLDFLLVQFGKEILNIVPGKVSTEVDAAYSFDKQGSIDKALKIIDLYKQEGISKDRVLIKLASTWEGIQAAHELQSKHGVNCNLTLMFSLVQAIAGAEAGAYLISPFVGRILDWYKAATKKEYTKEEDPGVKSVQQIFNYYKKHGYNTIVMGASFRTIGEITELAGCDYLTIAPNLLEQMYNSQDPVPKKLAAEDTAKLDIPKRSYLNDESKFRFDFNEETMAVHKLSEGISKFAADAVTLKGTLKEKLQA